MQKWKWMNVSVALTSADTSSTCHIEDKKKKIDSEVV